MGQDKKRKPRGFEKLRPRTPYEPVLAFISRYGPRAFEFKEINEWVSKLILAGDRKTLNQVVDAAKGIHSPKRGRGRKTDVLAFTQIGSQYTVLKLELRALRKNKICDDEIISHYNLDPVNNPIHKDALRLAKTGRPAEGAKKLVMETFKIGSRTFDEMRSSYNQSAKILTRRE